MHSLVFQMNDKGVEGILASKEFESIQSLVFKTVRDTATCLEKSNYCEKQIEKIDNGLNCLANRYVDLETTAMDILFRIFTPMFWKEGHGTKALNSLPDVMQQLKEECKQPGDQATEQEDPEARLERARTEMRDKYQKAMEDWKRPPKQVAHLDDNNNNVSDAETKFNDSMKTDLDETIKRVAQKTAKYKKDKTETPKTQTEEMKTALANSQESEISKPNTKETKQATDKIEITTEEAPFPLRYIPASLSQGSLTSKKSSMDEEEWERSPSPNPPFGHRRMRSISDDSIIKSPEKLIPAANEQKEVKSDTPLPKTPKTIDFPGNHRGKVPKSKAHSLAKPLPSVGRVKKMGKLKKPVKPQHHPYIDNWRLQGQKVKGQGQRGGDKGQGQAAKSHIVEDQEHHHKMKVVTKKEPPGHLEVLPPTEPSTSKTEEVEE